MTATARVTAADGAGPVSGAERLRRIVAARGIAVPADLLSPLGSRGGDGAATLWKINAAQTVVMSQITREATIDDAFECGRIAAGAALTELHAHAAEPLFARLICACPEAASDEAKDALIEGVAVMMGDAGAVLADARLVDSAALRFDLQAVGIVRPDRIRSAAGALPDDALIVAGPLGAGIYGAAQARGRLTVDDRARWIAATRSHRAGIAFGSIRNVHAVAAIGLSGLLGAVLAMARAARLAARITARAVPALPRALLLACAGNVAPDAARNWNRDGAVVRLDDTVMPEMRALLTDPAAAGTLLVACKAESTERVLAICRGEGLVEAAVVGRFDGEPANAAPWLHVA